jgi:hypothetical protein
MEAYSLERYTAALIQLHDMMAHGQGDSDEADSIRDEMDGLDRDAPVQERILVEGLSGDLYMIHGQGMYRKMRDEEKPGARLELNLLIDERRWPEALELLRANMDLSEEKVASYRAKIWEHIDPKVALLFREYATSRSGLKQTFEKAATEWENDTMHLSGPGPQDHPAYLAIIAMGKDTIPLILKKIADGCPWQWYGMLAKIIGDHPEILEKDRGRLEPVRKTYLEWAKSRGYFPDHDTPPKSTL